MKIRILVALVGIAASLAVTAYAQQKDAANVQLRQRLDALGQSYDEAFENGDATALAATFAEDAVLVTEDRTGLRSGGHREILYGTVPESAFQRLV
jgi:hypothetical protein